MALGDTIPTPADAVLIDNMTIAQRELFDTNLLLRLKVDIQEPSSGGTTLSFTLGIPSMVFVNGNPAPDWKPSTGYDTGTEIISNISYGEYDRITIIYKEKYT